MHQWNEIKAELEPDGSLRDIYVLDTNISIWEKLLTEITLSKYVFKFTHGEIQLDIPSCFSSIKTLQESNPTTLTILVNHIKINCHFFVESEIEMDICPSEVNSEDNFNSLIEFLKWLSKVSNSNVVLTHENSEDHVILTVCR
jgi:hypothetical protein